MDCPDHLECKEEKECVDPTCPHCAVNAHCMAINHNAICICNSGYEGCNAYGNEKLMCSILINSSFCSNDFFRMHNTLRLS